MPVRERNRADALKPRMEYKKGKKGRNGWTPESVVNEYNALCHRLDKAHEAGHFIIAEYRAVQNRYPTRVKFDEKVKIRMKEKQQPKPRNPF